MANRLVVAILWTMAGCILGFVLYFGVVYSFFFLDGIVRMTFTYSHTDALFYTGIAYAPLRVIEQLVVREPMTMRQLIDETKPCRWFASTQAPT